MRQLSVYVGRERGAVLSHRYATSAEILAAVRDRGYLVVRGVTCETCGGTGKTERDTNPAPNITRSRFIWCSTCEGRGLVPSPEAIKAAAMAGFPYEWEDGKRALPRMQAEAALMAAVDTEMSCPIEGCPSDGSHYHRDSLDGEEVAAVDTEET